MTAPCGVPVSACVTMPSSMTPAFSHLRIRRSMRAIADAMFHEPHQPVMAEPVEELLDIGVHDAVHVRARNPDRQRIQRIVLATPRPESVREPEEVRLVDRIEHLHHRALDDLVLQRSNAQWALRSVRFGDVLPPRR